MDNDNPTIEQLQEQVNQMKTAQEQLNQANKDLQTKLLESQQEALKAKAERDQANNIILNFNKDNKPQRTLKSILEDIV